jgi:hypothetical protein
MFQPRRPCAQARPPSTRSPGSRPTSRRTPSRCRWAPRHSGRASAADPLLNANQLGTRADGGRGQCGYPPHGRRPSAASLAALPLPSALARRQPGSVSSRDTKEGIGMTTADKEGNRMRTLIGATRFLLVGAVLAAAFAVSQGAAAAPASPRVSAQCTSETTTASWTHLRAGKVEFTWSVGTGTVTSSQLVSKNGAPRGELSVPTPPNAVSVFVAVETINHDRFGTPPVTCLIA